MVRIQQNGKRPKTKGKRKRGFSSSLFVLPFCFLLTLVLVTTIVPAMAQQQTPPTQGEIVQQPSTASELLQQGKQRYQAGQLSEAVSLWEQAARAYATNGEILNQSQTLNYLSWAYQDLGQWEKAQQAIANSLNLLQNVKELEPRGVALLGQALNTRGSLQLAKGEPEAAIETWKQAEAAYTSARNESGKLGSRINQAQAMQTLGLYRRARTLLAQLVAELETQPDTQLKADGLRSLGIALQTVGDLGDSKKILEKSWAISQSLDDSADTSATLLAIGNVARDLKQYDVAWDYYQEAAKQTPDAIAKVQTQLNQLSLLVETKQWEAARALVPTIQSNLANLSPSRASVYARVNLAESLMQQGSTNQYPVTDGKTIAQILATALQQARQLSDRRAEAYSLNQLGKLYEQTQQWKDAKSLSEQALQIAEQIDAPDIGARAAWQLGRLLKQQGNIPGAIAAYKIAFEDLQALRSDIVAVNQDIQFEFKESVEPIYRELVSLLLQPSQTPYYEGGNKGEVKSQNPSNQAADKGGDSQDNLKLARKVIEALQLAELDNFFGDACLPSKLVQIDEIDTQAAVIYPIILSDRLEVILSVPKQPLRHYATQLPSNEIDKILENFYSSLFPGYSNNDRLQLAKQVYDWLIRPADAALASSNIKTLVFIPDGFLRNVPMTALYDGQQYLVEKYSITYSPGLQLFSEGLESKDLTVLAAALTEARQGFSALPGVEGEIKKISSEVKSKILENQEFTLSSFQNAIEGLSYPIVHLATHGQFSSNPEETFLLTWDNQIKVKDLDLFFQKSRFGLAKTIELLVMSACQTAAGDKRAALGLAGVALRSGARSTIASLWSVNDESTAELMSEFYRQLTQRDKNTTKAEALRQAQLSLLHNSSHKHPYFWASFVLVGNWL
jgi:CHAT domain-containing protein